MCAQFGVIINIIVIDIYLIIPYNKFLQNI